jgi:prepilin-type N-terminal cleavage/methylation domain-containing protein
VGRCERGFTLIEAIVVASILAMLLAAGGLWAMSMHPGALAQATDDYDAALASARALAMTGSNGATMVFAPRLRGEKTIAGFTLRVYAGRPSSAGAVTATNTMPVQSDATITEKSLGAPPFAIFIGASGHVSGSADYPRISAKGVAKFAAIPTEPACPAKGFVLTFTSPQGATMTRDLPCIAAVAGSTAAPNPSPTPNVPMVTPSSLVYHWPADAEQTFVATEWGYTHWFASTSGFACGDGVATYPDVLPQPYSAPYTPDEAKLPPPVPMGEPFSYPNSGGGSMNDAPALFRLDPSVAGLCSATVADGYAQTASAGVQVMGWLTGTYGGNAYAHLTTPQLAIPATALSHAGQTVRIALSKTYDAQALQPQVVLGVQCAPYLTTSVAGGRTPATPSETPATATLSLQVVSLPQSPITCGGVIYDQYPGSQAGEGIPFNAAIGVVNPLVVWPASEKTSVNGALSFNAAGTPCLAIAYGDTSFGTPLANQKQYAAIGVSTDANGCLVNGDGSASTGAVVVTQPGFTSGSFTYDPKDCGQVLDFARSWSPDATGPGPDALSISGKAAGTCNISLVGNAGDGTGTGALPVDVVDSGCKPNVKCGVVIYGLYDTCASIGVGLFAFDYDAKTDYYQSIDGGTTWADVWQAEKVYAQGHATSCPPLSSLGPPESVYAAGEPPSGDPIDWAKTTVLALDGSVASTWYPAAPPPYVTSEFGEP